MSDERHEGRHGGRSWLVLAQVAGMVVGLFASGIAQADEAPAQEMAPAQAVDAAPAGEVAPAGEAAPAGEVAPAGEAAPAAGPVKEVPPLVIERIERQDEDGVMRGVLAKIDLTNPRVTLRIVPAEPEDPDGDGPNVTRLDTVLSIAERYEFELAVNASFFAAPAFREVGEKKIRYFVGNPAYPVGWLVTDGKVLTKPAKAGMATMVVQEGGRVDMASSFEQMPDGVRYAVSGNVMILDAGQIVHKPGGDRHPRTAVGVDAESKTLFLMVIDGRREGWSRGASYAELGQLMLEAGAVRAINLDGGGSTTMVMRDPSTDVISILNRPSDGTSLIPGVSIPRPVTDAIGIDIAD